MYNRVNWKDGQTELCDTNFNIMDKGIADVSVQASQISNPNILINGDFQIWQRGTDILVPNDGSTYTTDRWMSCHKNHEVQQLANTSPFPSLYMLRNINKGTANGQMYNYQIIGDYSKYQGKPLTLSFWIKGYGTTPYLACRIGADTNKGLTLTDQWQFVTVTVNSANFTDDYYNRGVIFYTVSSGPYPVGSGFDLAGVKLELGTIATPFHPRPTAEELMLCQRYYLPLDPNAWWVFNAVYGGDVRADIPTPSTFRAVPTLVYKDLPQVFTSTGWVTVDSMYVNPTPLSNKVILGLNIPSITTTGPYLVMKVPSLDAEIY
jgi:hypothetical protein